MRIGVICSAGGSAFLEVADACPHVEFFVLTDRPCGVEEGCKARNIPFVRIEEPSNEGFSARAAEILTARGEFDFVLMFFGRLVTEPLLSRFLLLNIHPGLLPAFKGKSAVRQAANGGVRFFGATLHIANAEMDAGPILAQACQPLRPGDAMPYLNKMSFLHKVSLFLVAIDLFETKNVRIENGQVHLNPALCAWDRLNPALTNPRYLEAVRRLQAREEALFLPL